MSGRTTGSSQCWIRPAGGLEQRKRSAGLGFILRDTTIISQNEILTYEFPMYRLVFHLTIPSCTQTTQIDVLIGSFSNCLNLSLTSSSAANAGLHIVSPAHQRHLVRFLCPREPAGSPSNTHFLEHQYPPEHIHRTLQKNVCTSSRPHRGDRYHFTTPSPGDA